MHTYLIRRVLLMFPTLIGITMVVFFVMANSPGGMMPRSLMQDRDGGTSMRPDERRAMEEHLRRMYGLDKPIIEQYGRWVNHVSPFGWEVNEKGELSGWPGFKWPNFGKNAKQRPVLDLVAERLPVTLLLNFLTIPIIYGVALLVGIYAARHRGSVFDVTSGAVLLGLWSIPTIWAGVLLIGFFASVQYFYWFPTAGLHDPASATMFMLPSWDSAGEFQGGYVLDTLWHLALPVLTMVYGGFAFLAKLMRTAVLENILADYARTARAKGVTERNILWSHVFRNSLLPLITVAATLLPALLAGSIIVETIYSIDGMGKLAVEAVTDRDKEVVMAITLISGLLTLVSYLIADIFYAIADPRVSYE